MAQTHLEEIAFSIIAAAGDGRAKVTEALKAAREGPCIAGEKFDGPFF